jgi:hypothetical protein
MLVKISNQAKLVAFVNYRRLEIKRKGGLGELGNKLGNKLYIYSAYFLAQKKETRG